MIFIEMKKKFSYITAIIKKLNFFTYISNIVNKLMYTIIKNI